MILSLANNKGAGQTARMHRLVCACVVRKPRKTDFLTIMHVFKDEINSSIIGLFQERKLLFTLGSFIRSHRFR